MAQDKKSFIAYSDWKETFDALPDDKAGQLIKHIFAYVNDENPKTDDILINAVFVNIRNTLKRDLKKWELQYNQRVEAGKRSAEVRRRNATSVNERSVSSTVSVSVSDSVNGTEEIKKVFNFKKSLIGLGVEPQIADDWIKVRKNKRATNSETAFNSIKSQILKSGLGANECIKKAVENSWSGFKSEWLNDNNDEKNRTNNKKGFKSDSSQQAANAIIQRLQSQAGNDIS